METQSKCLFLSNRICLRKKSPKAGQVKRIDSKKFLPIIVRLRLGKMAKEFLKPPRLAEISFAIEVGSSGQLSVCIIVTFIRVYFVFIKWKIKGGLVSLNVAEQDVGKTNFCL